VKNKYICIVCESIKYYKNIFLCKLYIILSPDIMSPEDFSINKEIKNLQNLDLEVEGDYKLFKIIFNLMKSI